MHVHQHAGVAPGDPLHPHRGSGWPTLLDLLGGATAVERIVERLLARLLHDPLLSPTLAGVDVALLKRHQARFFTEAVGAVGANRPLTPLTVRVSSAQFTRVLLHIHDTLVSLALPPSFTEQLMLAVVARGLDANDSDIPVRG
jgi:truncated hemoglobin YjbI